MRIALGIEYDGSAFSGWQFQDHSPSVQAVVEAALSKVADQPVRVVCAGRTDTGVHAAEQVVHFDTEVERSLRAWVFGANANLPKEVVVLWATPVSEEFHARFKACRRRYRYVIYNRPVRPTFLAWRTTWDYRPLDVARMQAAAQMLIGEHDFSSYRAQGCQAKSPVRTVTRLDVSRQEELVFIDIEANAFLHHMVRNIAGVLLAIGAGEQPVTWAKEVLEHRQRALGGVTAPPSGLYLMAVEYPAEFQLPQVHRSAAVW
ncbi:MAG: tRNA pseudouridine(38-40) synthase TruA [Gammaproteobacteria bacterium]|nr:tRNA pseudouridine(38-40) synthase TruA [Gammaproteobacteria bacterium]